MRIWSLVLAAGIGIALVACTITSLCLNGRTIDHPLFWLGVVVGAVAAIAHVGGHVRDHLLVGQAAVRAGQAAILERLAAIEEQIGEYGDGREVQGQAIAFAARAAAANGRHLGALPD